ncbi:MAG: DUF1704 domain-containing protein [Lachnospiraceae bacterium]|nr:DUF1704 domain-containing protein [Lachnospiraceae bacterium]
MELLQLINDTNIDVIETLNNTNIHAKEEFLSDRSLPKPNNIYGNMNHEQIKRNIDDILHALDHIGEDIHQNIEYNIAETMLQDNLKKNVFVFSNYEYNNAQRNKEELAMKQRCANIALYGEPKEDVFRSILYNKLTQIEESTLSPQQRVAYMELQDMIGDVVPQDGAVYYPSQEVVARFGEILNHFMDYIFRHIPSDKPAYTPADACMIANIVLREELSEIAGEWQAVVDSNASYASVSPISHKIVFPGKRNKGNYTLKELRAILVHELGVHAFRAMMYTACRFKPLSIGMPGYEAFEEGVAKACEQAVNNSYAPSGYMHYISIGLATFLKKSFRETFEIQMRLESLTNGEMAGRCFDSIQRAFRGTGELTNNKDLVYYNGSLMVWQYIEEHIDDPELIDNLFLCGKTNALDIVHERIIYSVRSGGEENRDF